MKKAIIIICTSASLLLILSTSGTLDALFLFITVGIIPGTTFSLSPNIMLSLIMLICLTLLCRAILRNNTALSEWLTQKLATTRRRLSRS